MRLFIGFLLFFGQTASGQYRFTLRIINEDTRQPIVGASLAVKGLNKGGTTDSAGLAPFDSLAQGSYVFQVTCMGYESREIRLQFPNQGPDTLVVAMEPDAEM